jgi:hypothetical protein
MRACSVSPLNLRQHVVYISGGVIVLRCGTNDFEFLASVTLRLAPARQV